MRSDREVEFRAYVVDARPGLLRTATLLAAGDGHLAEDLVQTTLTRLYLAWPRVSRAGSPHGYARRTLVNALIDERRRPFRKRETTRGELPDVPADAEPGAWGSATIERPQGRVEERTELTGSPSLQRALASLPAGMRAAVVFRHVHELSVAETAEALGCSQGNVKSQTARGLERLRSALAAAEGPPGGAAVPPEPANRPYANQSTPAALSRRSS